MNKKLVEHELVEDDSHFYKNKKQKTTSIEEANVQSRCDNNQDYFDW
jgi:hypothetical protein